MAAPSCIPPAPALPARRLWVAPRTLPSAASACRTASAKACLAAASVALSLAALDSGRSVSTLAPSARPCPARMQTPRLSGTPLIQAPGPHQAAPPAPAASERTTQRELSAFRVSLGSSRPAPEARPATCALLGATAQGSSPRPAHPVQPLGTAAAQALETRRWPSHRALSPNTRPLSTNTTISLTPFLPICLGRCPDGTFSDATGLSDASQCTPCPPGRHSSPLTQTLTLP